MPLIYRSELPNGLIVLWKIDESETELRSLCTPQERIYASERLTTGNRRKEWLAWHALLHETTPQAETGYDPNGAPVLKSGESRSEIPFPGRTATVRHGGRPAG